MLAGLQTLLNIHIQNRRRSFLQHRHLDAASLAKRLQPDNGYWACNRKKPLRALIETSPLLPELVETFVQLGASMTVFI